MTARAVSSISAKVGVVIIFAALSGLVLSVKLC